MTRLSKRDLGLLLCFFQRIHSCRSEEEFPKRVVTELANLVPAQHIIWNYVAPSVPAVLIVAHLEIADGESRSALFVEHMREHPVVQNLLRTDDRRPRANSDFWSEREFHEAPIFRALYRDMGLGDQIGFWLSGLAQEIVGIGLNRWRGNFSERDRALLDLARPQVALAWRNARAFSRVRRLAMTKRSANMRQGKTIVNLDVDGRISRLPGRARQWLKEFYCESSSACRRLPGDLDSWVARRRHDTQGGRKRCPNPGPLVMERDGRQLAARLFENSRGWLLVLERFPHPRAAQRLRRAGLTARETSVLLEVEKGRTNKEIAAALFISPLTARKHLENIYGKLRVTCRTAAIRVAREYLDRDDPSLAR